MTQLPEKQNISGVKYLSADGQDVMLDAEMVKKYLVHGRPEMVSLQEVVFFMNICKARKLNPLVKDCYLIKYGNEPAAVVTSIDFYRKRARAQKDCTGWKKGVIVLTRDGQQKETYGLVLPGEKLVGGWFEAKPRGWEEPFRLEVNLEAHIKKTGDGRTTRFWSPENQASQIMKVAESQGLRTLWPDEFSKLYTQEEIDSGEETISQNEKLHALEAELAENQAVPQAQEAVKAQEDIKALFEKQVKGSGIKYGSMKKVHEFVQKCADHNKMDTTAIMKGALENIQGFMSGFTKWSANGERKKEQPVTATDEQMNRFADLCTEKGLTEFEQEDFLTFCLEGNENSSSSMDGIIGSFDDMIATFIHKQAQK